MPPDEPVVILITTDDLLDPLCDFCSATEIAWRYPCASFDLTGLPWSVIARRLKRGWTIEESLTTPLGVRLHPNYITGPSHHWAGKR